MRYANPHVFNEAGLHTAQGPTSGRIFGVARCRAEFRASHDATARRRWWRRGMLRSRRLGGLGRGAWAGRTKHG